MPHSEEEERIGVVVVNYGDPELVRRNLLVSDDDLVVVMVDNFSTPANRDAARALARDQGWILVAGPNLGFGAGMNAGVGRALEDGCQAVVLVNPDLRIGAAQVRKLAGAALAEAASLVAPVIRDGSGEVWGRLGCVDVRAGRLFSRSDTRSDLHWLTGACLAVSAATWSMLGGFDEDFFMYWEDVDLCVRLQQQGGALRVLSGVEVVHDVGGTQGVGRSRLYYYYNCRNRLVFAARRLGLRDQLRWLLLTPGDVRRVAVRDPRLSRWGRVRRALPACLAGASAGTLWMARANARELMPSRSARGRRDS